MIAITLTMLLAAAAAQPPAHTTEQKKADALLCPGGAMGVFLPDPQGTPSPNIKLESFQYQSVDDPCGRNMDNTELMHLHEQVKPIVAAAFSKSQSSFGVMIRYTLTPDKPAEFEMRTREAPDSAKEQLDAFYSQASALKEFHSTAGTVYVLFQYSVSPEQPASQKKAK